MPPCDFAWCRLRGSSQPRADAPPWLCPAFTTRHPPRPPTQRSTLDKTTSRLLNLIAAAAEPEAQPRPAVSAALSSDAAETFASDFFPASSAADSVAFARLPAEPEASESVAMPAFSGADAPEDTDPDHEGADSSELIEWALGLPEYGGACESPR